VGSRIGLFVFLFRPLDWGWLYTGRGFRIYASGSAFYLWVRIPERYQDAMQLNEMLISRAGVAGVPGSAFADSDVYDSHLRLCIAREDKILRGALDKIQNALSKRHM
jgi:aspartate/methionine/tyrosine aminotransferase